MKKKIFASDEVVAEILSRARADVQFATLLFEHPQEALARFGVVIPGAFGEDYRATVYAAFDRAEFYRWYNEKILHELRAGSRTTAPGPCVTAAEHEDLDWDFEVTKYKP